MQRIRCWRCAEVQAPAFLCTSCGAVQPLPADVDYFAALGFPSHPALDERELGARYYDLSRKLHPDRFQTASPEEQRASVQASSVLNAAYQTLRTTAGRGRYWLTRLGEDLGKESQRVPGELAALLFEVQERLSELRGSDRPESRRELASVASDVSRRVTDAEAELDDLLRSWPRMNGAASAAAPAPAAMVDALKRTLSDLAYLRTLDRDVRAALPD